MLSITHIFPQGNSTAALSISILPSSRLFRYFMASGFGISGTTGRCFPSWMDFSECISKTDDPSKCTTLRDDYLECLHHRKEFTRLNAIYRERRKQLKEGVDRLAEEAEKK